MTYSMLQLGHQNTSGINMKNSLFITFVRSARGILNVTQSTKGKLFTGLAMTYAAYGLGRESGRNEALKRSSIVTMHPLEGSDSGYAPGTRGLSDQELETLADYAYHLNPTQARELLPAIVGLSRLAPGEEIAGVVSPIEAKDASTGSSFSIRGPRP